MARIQRALISVSDKQGIVDFARALSSLGVELLSTGGTARLLRESGLVVTDVSDYTGFPEIMDGRVKTLHPKVAGGLLGRDGIDDEAMRTHDIAPIDLLVVNLYPFEQTVARADCSFEDGIENIDIGGPSMLRAAAKNHDRVTVVVASQDYPRVLRELDENEGQTTRSTRRELALKVFQHTAAYDAAISSWLQARLDGAEQALSDRLVLSLRKRQDMRYGENPHQRAAFYVEASQAEPGIGTATQLNGKALSYNNVADADAALECVKAFEAPACVIVKHANPCGVAVDRDIGSAYERAFSTDPTSAFGGIIAFNRTLDAATARSIIDRQFVEVIIVPDSDPAATEIVREKENVRLLVCGGWTGQRPRTLDFKRVAGGLLVQDRDLGAVDAADLQIVTRRRPEPSELEDLLFAFKVVKFVKSNAIVYARDGMTVGIGAGQMSRVYSARIGVIKAEDEGLQVEGSVLASDAFFPFRDGIDAAARAGVSAVIQPGGSMRDREVIAAADEHDMAMVFTGIRHFRH